MTWNIRNRACLLWANTVFSMPYITVSNGLKSLFIILLAKNKSRSNSWTCIKYSVFATSAFKRRVSYDIKSDVFLPFWASKYHLFSLHTFERKFKWMQTSSVFLSLLFSPHFKCYFWHSQSFLEMVEIHRFNLTLNRVLALPSCPSNVNLEFFSYVMKAV